MSATVRMAVVPADRDLLAACLRLDELAVQGSSSRGAELTVACEENRLRVALREERPCGYAVVARWFLGVSFLELLYVSRDCRRRGLGRRLLEDFEEEHPRPVFTSTNASNLPMRTLLTQRGWEERGVLHGLDSGDPEIFYGKAL